ncbi:MAG: serine hydrolase domain-containing protein [Pseudomonadota bacterium]
MSAPGIRQRLRKIAVGAALCGLGGTPGICAEPVFEPKALKDWADGLLGAAFEERRLSGAAVGVIQGGETLLLEAYGWEDAPREIPLDPQRSRMRMCSLSKSFTAVSALQLIEGGLLPDLDTPVNRHLTRYRLPEPWGDRVTLRQLMTHSSGMTGGGTPQGAHTDIPTPVSRQEFARLLRENLIREPGQISLYANLGVALEGALIEDVSGLTLADYMAQNIFAPLDMENTLLHHSLALPENLATPAAVFPSGELQPVAFFPKHPSAAASGGIISTPADMLRYAAFHADLASYVYDEVLSRERRASMQHVQFRANPLVEGVGLHLYPRRYGEYAMASHGCGLPGFASHMAVIPELQLGFYLTLMSATPVPDLSDLLMSAIGRGRLIPGEAGPKGERLSSTEKVWDSFAENFLPPRVMPEARTDGTPPQPIARDKLPGTYWVERRPFTSMAKVFYAGNTRRVTLGTEGAEGDTLWIGKEEYRAIGDGAFARVEDLSDRVAFKQLSNGDLYLTSNSAAWRKVSRLGDPRIWSWCLVLGLLTLLSGFLAPLWRLPPPAESNQGHWLAPKRLALLAATGVVALSLPITLGTDNLAQAFIQYSNNDFLRMTVLLLILNVVLVMALLLGLGTLQVWRRSGPSPGLRAYLSLTHASLLGISTVALFGAMLFFNLVGIQL